MMTFRKMDDKEKIKWLKALRGGKFVQGQNQLARSRDEDGIDCDQHCCLGVFAKAVKNRLSAGFAGYDFTPNTETNEKSGYTTFGTRCRLGANQKLSTHSGFVPPSWIDPRAQVILSQMNDGKQTFGMIADWIEENL